MVLRIPPRHSGLVVLLHEQPLVPAAATPSDEGEATGELDAGQVEAKIARLDRGDRVVATGHRPRPPVPHRDIAAAVLACADDALEVEVVQRVIVDVDSQPPHVGIEGRTFRHGPAQQHALRLQAQVVVQPASAMALDDEPSAVGGWRWRHHDILATQCGATGALDRQR